ncbi:hypothetical protein SLEP1_g27633 [Rubroshorea leprosula]|uniref:Uncharacterized protein n=1 Tax=Rubroshorea leprosula TaxID=152421 RepID=A0AAV5K2D4_9ROSI|nr:hypothetical protein SLEP1_g27633 [Rubroshorea leprosula]
MKPTLLQSNAAHLCVASRFPLTGQSSTSIKLELDILLTYILSVNKVKAASPVATSRIRGELLKGKLPTSTMSEMSSKSCTPDADSQLVGGGCIGSGNYRGDGRWKLILSYYLRLPPSFVRWLLLIVGDFWAYFLISRELPLEFSAECRRPLPPLQLRFLLENSGVIS